MRIHGANPEKVFESFGIPIPTKILDFSTNTNVVPFPLRPKIDWWTIVGEYPDDECISLRTLIGDQEGVEINEVMFFNGSNEAIYQMISQKPNGKAALLQPLYGEYEKALTAYNYEIEHLFSEDEIFGLEHCDFLFICNPNNPTGQVMENEKLATIARYCQKNEIVLVLDEAYHYFLDYVTPISHWIKENEYLIILRSLTKIYGLSGIRLGYCLGHKSRISRLKETHPTWSVNGVAQVLGLAYLKDANYLKDTKSFYAGERCRMVKEIHSLGYNTRPTQVNYFLLSVEDDEDIIRFLLSKGIVVRHTRNFKSLDGNYVRIAVKSSVDNDYLIEALREFKILKKKD